MTILSEKLDGLNQMSSILLADEAVAEWINKKLLFFHVYQYTKQNDCFLLALNYLQVFRNEASFIFYSGSFKNSIL